MKVFVILFIANLVSTLPAPQSQEDNSVDNKIVNLDVNDVENSDADDKESSPPEGLGPVYDNYGDYEGTYDVTENKPANSDSNLGEILGLFGQIGSDLVSLAREKGKLVHSLLQDKELRARVGTLVAAGVNGTQTLVRASGPVVDQIRRSFTNTSRLAGNLVKAAGETAPLARETLEEYGNQAPLISGIARSYAEINIENAQNVVKAFHESLKCNNECGDFEEGELKEECREKHCKPEE